MKLKASASVNFLFPGASAEQVVEEASRSGFNALEFQILGPSEAERFAPVIEASSLAVSLVNFDVMHFVQGGAGYSGVPGRAEEFEVALNNAFHTARLLNPGFMHIGPSRIPDGVRRDHCVAQLADNLRRALDRFAPISTRLSVEALNRVEFPDVLIGSPEEAMEIIESVGDSRLVFQYDIYHAARDSRDIQRDLNTFLDRIGHVQFADCPGRHEPGTGNTDFRSIFATLRSLGYGGFVGAEYKPSGNLEDSLAWMKYLGNQDSLRA